VSCSLAHVSASEPSHSIALTWYHFKVVYGFGVFLFVGSAILFPVGDLFGFRSKDLTFLLSFIRLILSWGQTVIVNLFLRFDY
jgi:hypothetical protein